MRTIMIPTDFTVTSLIPVKKILQVNGTDEVRVLLFHCLHVSDSITDLLLFSKAKEIRKLSSPEFTDACEIIRNRFAPHLKMLAIDIFTGNTEAAFENFVEGHQADTICMAKDFTFTSPSRYSVEPLQYIKKASVPVLEMVMEIPTSPLTQNRVAALFSEMQ